MIKQESSAKVDKFLFIAAVAALALAVSVWGFRQIAQSRRTVIVVSRSGENLFGAEAFGVLAQEFEKHNPDLRIRLADDGADIVFFDDSEIGGLLAESALASLGPYIHSETEARQWALPLVSFTDIFLYNIDILQAADMDRPPKTRAELLAAARAIAEQEAAHPLALGLSEDDPLALRRELYPWIWAVGGELRQDGVRQNGGQNGDQSGSESVTLSRATTEAIAFFGQLNSEGLLAPGSFEKTRAQRLQEFAGGSVAMLVASSRDLPLLRNSAAAISYSVTAIPQAAQGKNRLGLSGIYAGISSGCTLTDEAWAFLAFIAGRKHLLEEALSAIPGSYPGTFPADYITSDPLYSKTWDIFEAADIVEYHTADPLEEETSRIIREKLEEAFE